jgi:ribosomal protein S12
MRRFSYRDSFLLFRVFKNALQEVLLRKGEQSTNKLDCKTDGQGICTHTYVVPASRPAKELAKFIRVKLPQSF